MIREQVKLIAEKKEVKDIKVFVDFIMTRFPNEQFASYVEEWADRFNSGLHKGCMDNSSLRVYDVITRGFTCPKKEEGMDSCKECPRFCDDCNGVDEE